MTDKIVSPNGLYELDIQDDGNLVSYRRADGVPIWASGGDPDPLPPSPPPPMTALPPLVINGEFFALETGQRWTAVECSEFNLLNRWQHNEDIRPILEQRAGAGFNLLRVWTLYDLADKGIGTFVDIDYSSAPQFVALCASYGLYVEFTAYTSIERYDHWDNLTAACQTCATKPLLELVNEGTLDVNKIHMNLYGKPAGLLCSRGSGGSEGEPPWEPWDYCTWHTNGADEEQRKVGKQSFDLCQVEGVPTLTNETSRFPDVGMWVGATPERTVSLAMDSAAGAALLCAGSCFHSAAGKASTLWDTATRQVAQAWAASARMVSTACQPFSYRRRDDLLTDEYLRVYQRGEAGCIVKIRK